MSRIRSRDTMPEMLVRRFLHRHGFRYVLHDKRLPGKPDIVLPKYRTVIFVNGCFWHGHKGCRYFILPKTREQWWKDKISKTVAGDHANKEKLEIDGWNVINIFECDLKKEKREGTMNRIIDALNG